MIKPYFRRHARPCGAKNAIYGRFVNRPYKNNRLHRRGETRKPPKLTSFVSGNPCRIARKTHQQLSRVPIMAKFYLMRRAFHFRLALDGSLPFSPVNFAEQNLETKGAVRRRFRRGQNMCACGFVCTSQALKRHACLLLFVLFFQIKKRT